MRVHTLNDKVDYKTKFITLKDIRKTPFNLPNNMELKLERVLDNLNFNACSSDLIYQNRDFYFLETNPTGQVSSLCNTCYYYIEYKLAIHSMNEA